MLIENFGDADRIPHCAHRRPRSGEHDPAKRARPRSVEGGYGNGQRSTWDLMASLRALEVLLMDQDRAQQEALESPPSPMRNCREDVEIARQVRQVLNGASR